MERPGGRGDLTIDCDGWDGDGPCERFVVVGYIVTPAGATVGAHIVQTVYNVETLTVHGGRVYCYACREREARQLNLRNG